ncbi:MAG: hypothetical protein ACK5OB_15630 [Pirellula sp.]
MLRSHWVWARMLVWGLALAVGSGRSTDAAVYNASLDISQFGYLSQGDIPGFGNVASAPVSATNMFVYLQNRNPLQYGNTLTGSTLSDWRSTATTLASDTYMDTIDNSGTFARDLIYGTTTYVDGFAPAPLPFAGQAVLESGQPWTPARPQPSFVRTVYPTWQFIYDALANQFPVLIDIFVPGTNNPGHTVVLTSFHWDDANNNRLIEIGEGAKWDFLDPLDPVNSTNDGAERRLGNIYEELLPDDSLGSTRLRVDYTVPGLLPLGGPEDRYIGAALTVVPEPSSLVVFACLGILGGRQIAKRRRGLANG